MKPTLIIYINNTIAFIILKILSIFFKQKRTNKEGILFINTGQIGDIIISSMFLENEHCFRNDLQLYLVIKKEYSSIFKEYSGRFNIVEWDYKKYKWSIFYRINFIKKLRSLEYNQTYNLTSARGVTCDELALLSGSKQIYCLNSNWKYLKKCFGIRIDKKYNDILFKEYKNEYEKHIEVFKRTTKKDRPIISTKNSNLFNSTKTKLLNNKFIVISPFSSDNSRAYGLNNYLEISKQLSSTYQIVLVGNSKEKDNSFLLPKIYDNIINLIGKTELLEVLQIIKNCALFIGNDSGLTHAALKFNIPLIAIIGGGNYGKYFPFMEDEKRSFLYYLLECFDCEWKCIYSEKYCLTKVPLDIVIEKANKLLN